MSRIAVIGAGLTGCTIAQRCAERGHDVTVFDRNDFIGGLCADGHNDLGVFVQRFGPHIFHTDNPQVWRFVNHFATFKPYEHQVIADVQGHLVPVPINKVTLDRLGQDAAWAREAIMDAYNRKMWGDTPPDGVGSRFMARDSCDCFYFTDRYQGIPQCGYSRMIERMLASDRIDVELGQDIGPMGALPGAFDTIFHTGRPDRTFAYSQGALPFRTMRLTWNVTSYCPNLPAPVVNLPDADAPFIRRTEYPRFVGLTDHLWALCSETPVDGTNDPWPMYPVPTEASRKLWRAYQSALPNVHLAGRAGRYEYLDMDDAILDGWRAVQGAGL